MGFIIRLMNKIRVSYMRSVAMTRQGLLDLLVFFLLESIKIVFDFCKWKLVSVLLFISTCARSCLFLDLLPGFQCDSSSVPSMFVCNMMCACALLCLNNEVDQLTRPVSHERIQTSIWSYIHVCLEKNQNIACSTR